MHESQAYSDLRTDLRAAGIARIIARFSGGNDEGQIDSITLAGAGGEAGLNPQDPRYETLERVIEDGLPGGYHYGPGGHGTAILDLATDRVTTTFVRDDEW